MEFEGWRLALLESERGYGDGDGEEDLLTSPCPRPLRRGSYLRREYPAGDEPIAGDAYLSTTSVMFRDAEGVVFLLLELAML